MKRTVPTLFLMAAGFILLFASPGRAAASGETQQAALSPGLHVAPITVTSPTPSGSLDLKSLELLQNLSDIATRQAEATARGRKLGRAIEVLAPEIAMRGAVLSGTLRLPVVPRSSLPKLYESLRREGVTSEVWLQDGNGTLMARASITIHSANIRWMTSIKAKRLVYRRDAYEIVAQKAVNGAVKELARQMDERAKTQANADPGGNRP